MTARASTAASAAIAGIGATEFSKNSGRSELRLAAEAVRTALDDAALTPADVDGLVTFTMDSNAEIAVARELGIPGLSFFGQVGYGGGAACATAGARARASTPFDDSGVPSGSAWVWPPGPCAWPPWPWSCPWPPS